MEQETVEQRVARFLSSSAQLLIGGRFVSAASGRTFPVVNPATGEVIAQAAHGQTEDVSRAVAAARQAFDDGPWRTMSPAQRARLIYRLGDAIEKHGDEIALIETLDNGRPLAMSRSVEVPVAVERLRYYSGWATKLEGATIDVSLPGQWHAYTLREPVGVAALIVPWNFPFTMAVAKIAPALAAGCTVILKPAEQTPLSALRLAQLVVDVGFPAGVINVVTGFGDAGEALVNDQRVDKVSFTGSTEVGKLITRQATGNLKRITLELGGKSPVVIFPDADLDKAIDGASRAIFANAGQVCTAGSRLYAHEKVYERVVEGIADRAKKMKIGSGLDPETEMGPLISQEQLDRVLNYVQSGRKEGAKIVVGGERLDRSGYFVAPTVISHTTPNMAVRREEIFGPVLCADSFDDIELESIVDEANDSIYGLMAYIWTRDLSVAHKVARRLKAGTVRINGGAMDSSLPFGGFKQSGWGRENGREGVEAYTELKSVLIGL